MCVCLFPGSSKLAKPEILLDDDSPLDEDGFRLRKYPNSAAVSLYSFFHDGYLIISEGMVVVSLFI